MGNILFISKRFPRSTPTSLCNSIPQLEKKSGRVVSFQSTHLMAEYFKAPYLDRTCSCTTSLPSQMASCDNGGPGPTYLCRDVKVRVVSHHLRLRLAHSLFLYQLRNSTSIDVPMEFWTDERVRASVRGLHFNGWRVHRSYTDHLLRPPP